MHEDITYKKAMEVFKTPSSLAKACDTSPQNVNAWRKADEIPELYRYKLKYEVFPLFLGGRS